MSDWEDLKIRNETDNQPDRAKLSAFLENKLPNDKVVSFGRSY